MTIPNQAVLPGLTAIILLFLIMVASFNALSEEEHEHAHEWLHFSHPLITESPTPDTKVRLDYFFLDVDGEVEDEELGEEGEGPQKFKESTIRLILEYAFTRNISIEAGIPYTFLNVDEGPNENNFNNIELAVNICIGAVRRSPGRRNGARAPDRQ